MTSRVHGNGSNFNVYNNHSNNSNPASSNNKVTSCRERIIFIDLEEEDYNDRNYCPVKEKEVVPKEELDEEDYNDRNYYPVKEKEVVQKEEKVLSKSYIKFTKTPRDPNNKSDLALNNILSYSRRGDPQLLALSSKVSNSITHSDSHSTDSETSFEALPAKERKTKYIPSKIKQPIRKSHKRKLDELSNRISSSTSQSSIPSASISNEPEETALDVHSETGLPLKKRMKHAHPSAQEPESSVHNTPPKSIFLPSVTPSAIQKAAYEQNECFIIPLPYENESYENAIKIAWSIHLQQQSAPQQTRALLRYLFKIIYSLSKEEIREGKLKSEANAVNKGEAAHGFWTILNKLKKFESTYPSNTNSINNNFKIKIFDFKNNQYTLSRTENETGKDTLCLYRKNKADGSFHYDLLISNISTPPFLL